MYPYGSQHPTQTTTWGIRRLYIYEPFGLGRFATDHSQTKPAPRALFVRLIGKHQDEK